MENTVSNYEAVWWIGATCLLAAFIIAAVWFAIHGRSDRWCVYVEGPDELECHPSKEAAERRAEDLNTFFATMPKGGMRPPMFAKVIPSDLSGQDHDAEVTRCRETQAQLTSERQGMQDGEEMSA